MSDSARSGTIGPDAMIGLAGACGGGTVPAAYRF